jgi:PKD repeat protein
MKGRWVLPYLLVVALGARAEVCLAATPIPKVESLVLSATQPASTDANVIWYDSFDTDRSEYFEKTGGLSTSEHLGGAGASMQCYYPAGETGVGNRKIALGDCPFGSPVHSDASYDDIYWRLYVKHQVGWTGNPMKMSRASGFVSSSWNQAFVEHVWGGTGLALLLDPVSGCEDSQVVTTTWNDFANFSWLGATEGSFPLHDTAEAGRWVCVESRMKLNTPGLQDGYIALWVDGRLDAEHSGLDFRQSWTGKGINALFLEAYWNDGSPVDQYRWYDDFVISTQPIGPLTAPANPQLLKTAYASGGGWEAQLASDADGADVVWAANAAAGVEGEALTVNAASGTFAGSQAGRTSLAGGAYYCRVRQQDALGVWSDWSDWHQPFQVAAPAGAPVAGFTAAPASGVAPLTVSFTDASANSPTSWAWSFGDGEASAFQNPSHSYPAAGRYSVSLTATNDLGSDLAAVDEAVRVATFVDVLPDSWAWLAVESCVAAGLVGGYGDGSYRPGDAVTRDQMAVYVARGLAGGDAGVTTPTGPASFSDVPVDHWAYRYVEYAKAQLVVQGYEGGTYRPTESVDRGQMAVYIARAMVAPLGDAGLATYTPPATPTFSDVATDYWAYRHLEYLADASRSIVHGYEDGAYHPEYVVTRDQMAVYVSRAFALVWQPPAPSARYPGHV